jgi:hypothetical protein
MTAPRCAAPVHASTLPAGRDFFLANDKVTRAMQTIGCRIVHEFDWKRPGTKALCSRNSAVSIYRLARSQDFAMASQFVRGDPMIQQCRIVFLMNNHCKKPTTFYSPTTPTSS